MKISEVAELVGISVRTLHHYDEIGLLTPESISESGYRLYSEENLEMLQQILFFKELDFPLKKIKEIVTDPTFNRKEALELQRELLVEKRNRIDTMIRTLQKTIQHMEGEIVMSNQEKFEGFNFQSNPYEEEARKRYGDRVVDKSKEKLAKMSQHDLSEEMNGIYWKLAGLRKTSPNSEESQAAIDQWFHFLNNVGTYSYEAFKGLGELYVSDERFTKNIDQFGEGLANFMCEAMAIYAENNLRK